jgi:S1-C subfamily serine protease
MINTRNPARIFALALILAACAAAAFSHTERPQQKTVRMQFDADKSVLLNEAGVVIAEKDGKLAVEFVFPKDKQPKEIADLDIAVGDEVGMAMGKKVATAKELHAVYDSAKPGQEFKLGLRRDGKAFIAVFRKLDQKDMPKTMVVKSGGGDNPNQDVRPALGVVIEQKDGKVFIDDTFPNAPKEMLKGDVVVSVNGTAVKDLQRFSDVYDNVEVGGEVKFALGRGGKTVTVTIKRPKPQGQVIVK